MLPDFLYNTSIRAYTLIIKGLSPFNNKAKLWVDGRKNIFKKLRVDAERRLLVNNNPQVAWFHCASLGEFEQGRPVIEAFSKAYPSYKILVTFFSPSGYEIRKNYTGADYVYYLPTDTPENARKFVEIVQPKIAFFVKYEFWRNYINELKQKNIPAISFSAIFRPNQIFFKLYGGFYRQTLYQFYHILVQNRQSQALLKSINIDQVTIAGDTRFDRVKKIVEAKKEILIAKKFKSDSQVFIIGSAWQEDISVLTPLMNEVDSIKFIIAPHEVHKAEIELWRKEFTKKTICFSEVEEKTDLRAYRVLIIDNVGMLSSLYQYAEYAFIGGSFGKGLHNILEAATFGMPIFFGDKAYQKFQEAADLIRLGGAFAVGSTEDIALIFKELRENEAKRLQTADVCRNYVLDNVGATEKVMKVVASVAGFK